MTRTGKKLRKGATWLNVSAVGLQFPIAMLIGYFWGKWLDGVFGTEPWLMAIFSLCGIIAGFVNLFRMTAAATREEQREARRRAEEEADGDNGI